MSLSDLHSGQLKPVLWIKEKGNFVTWRAGSYLWHSPKKFNQGGAGVFIYSEVLRKLPKRKIIYLRGVRQHIWRRCQDIKGFMPLVGLDIMSPKVILGVRQISPITPNLCSTFVSFLQSADHKKLLSWVCN